MYENQLTSRFTRSRCQRISLQAQTHSLISDLVEAFHWKIYMAKMPTVCIFSAERIFILNGIFLNSLRARPVSCENFPVFLECNRQIDVLSVRVQHGGKSILPYNNIFAFTHPHWDSPIQTHRRKKIAQISHTSTSFDENGQQQQISIKMCNTFVGSWASDEMAERFRAARSLTAKKNVFMVRCLCFGWGRVIDR